LLLLRQQMQMARQIHLQCTEHTAQGAAPAGPAVPLHEVPGRCCPDGSSQPGWSTPATAQAAALLAASSSAASSSITAATQQGAFIHIRSDAAIECFMC
jgi:hypothetical protein